ncbi:EF-P 5-aminopentanol modification-associated protein YfmH [Metabacillus sp. 113a]|uniref:EF-P 5-aminopentanol modification-associated protein YfmH n=1 Tax=Metabacillus sp. 113a TaxID=3404706 RepID=UPI003CF34F9C
MVKPIQFKQLQEELYHEQMENGLNVYVLPKKGFNKTYATFTARYGSIDNEFVPLGQEEMKKVPDGIAHFLEHKLFEKEDGDVFQQFSKQGASSNAFTSFTRTAYLFSSTADAETNLETLIDFVQEPYFTEQSVEKEKGIIGQEIDMYDDNPDWRLYFGLIQNMYEKHPVKIDIAGTVESISHITKDLLYECYHTFYHPSNMLLFVTGPVDPEQVLNQIRENQNKKSFDPPQEIKRPGLSESKEVYKSSESLPMNVQSSKCLVGIKAKVTGFAGEELLKKELTANLILDVLFGKSSVQYQDMYSNGLIDDTFSYDYTEEETFGFGMIGGDTDRPEELSDQIKEILLKAKQEGIQKDRLDTAVKKRIGAFLRSVNSPEYIANQFTRYAFNDMNLFDVVPVLEQISKEDADGLLMEMADESQMTVFTVVPKKTGQQQ